MFPVSFTSLAQLRDTVEDLAMWCAKECKLIIREQRLGPRFQQDPHEEIIREGGKRLEIILEMFNYPDDSNYNVIQNENFILTRKVISTDS